jgi:hypothetical protein
MVQAFIAAQADEAVSVVLVFAGRPRLVLQAFPFASLPLR